MKNAKVKAIEAILEKGLLEEGRALTKRAFRAAKKRYNEMSQEERAEVVKPS